MTEVVGISDFVSAVKAACQIRRISFEAKGSKSGAPTLVVKAKGKQLSLTLAAGDDCINDVRTVQFLKVTFGKSVDNWPEPIKNLVVQNAIVEPQAAAVPSFQGAVTDENNNSDQHGRLSFVEGIKAAATRWFPQDAPAAPHERLGIVELIKTSANNVSSQYLSLVKAIQDSAIRFSEQPKKRGIKKPKRSRPANKAKPITVVESVEERGVANGTPVDNNIQEISMDDKTGSRMGDGQATKRLKVVAGSFNPQAKAPSRKPRKTPAAPPENLGNSDQQMVDSFCAVAERIVYTWVNYGEKAQDLASSAAFVTAYDLTRASLRGQHEEWQKIAVTLGDRQSKAGSIQKRFETGFMKAAGVVDINKKDVLAALAVYEKARWSETTNKLVAKAFVPTADQGKVVVPAAVAPRVEAARAKVLASMQLALTKSAQPA